MAGLVEGMTELPGGEPHEIVLVPFTWRGTADLARVAPPADRRVRQRRPGGLPEDDLARMVAGAAAFTWAACARATLTAYRRALGAAR